MVEELGSFCPGMRGVHIDQLVYIGCQGQRGTLFDLSLLYVSKALFCPVPYSVVFSLLTLKPRCSGQNVWISISGS